MAFRMIYGDGGTEDLVLQNRTNYYNIKKITDFTTKQEHPEYLLQFNDVYDRVYSRDYMNTYNKHANFFHDLVMNKNYRK